MGNNSTTQNKGGLGVGYRLVENEALLFKWWWRYACEEGASWRKVINSTHNEDLAALPTNSLTNMLGPWKEIKRLALEPQPLQIAFFQNLRMQLGEGTKISFWIDIWTDGASLKSIYRRLYEVSSQQQ